MLTINGKINEVGELRQTKIGKSVRDVKLKYDQGFIVFSLWDEYADKFHGKVDDEAEVTFSLYSAKNKYGWYDYKVSDVSFNLPTIYADEPPEKYKVERPLFKKEDDDDPQDDLPF